MPSVSRAFVAATTTSSTEPVEQNKRRRGKALPALLAVCVLLGALLPLSRKLLFSKPVPPPASADIEVQRRFWKERIQRDVADKDAYLQLGIVEEKAGYFVAARRALESARALGVPDAQVSGPLGRALT
jgi:hypothetical protein